MKRRCYIGFDARDALAYDVCRRSLLAHASCDVEIIPLRDWELRKRKLYWREYHVAPDGQMFDLRDGKPFSTAFSFTRFCVPALEEYGEEWVLFCDADMMFRADVEDLFALAEDTYSVMVVKHQHMASNLLKMDGVLQTANRHGRKNWSSLMLLRPSKCRELTRFSVNNATGDFLHSLCWAREADIGSLPPRWNHLVGYDTPEAGEIAAVLHHTNGTPDMVPDTDYADEWWRWARAVG